MDIHREVGASNLKDEESTTEEDSKIDSQSSLDMHDTDVVQNRAVSSLRAERQLQPSSTWPNLPVLALTTSDDSDNFRPVDMPKSPSVESIPSHTMLDSEIFADKNASINGVCDKKGTERNVRANTDSESDTIDLIDQHGQSKQAVLDDDASLNTLSQMPSLNNDHHRVTTEFGLDDSAANTLVEAALDKDEAKDRHVRFQDHVMESAALVQRMLSVKMGRVPEADPLGRYMQARHEQHQPEEEEIELDSPLHHQHHLGGGSVLASLMKLEAQRHTEETVKKKKKKNKHRKSFQMNRHKKHKPASIHEYPIRSNTDPFSDASMGQTPVKARPQRPPLVNRPTSWLSSVSHSRYVVPSLEKRKKTAAPSVSRRSSNDSMLTTASQFEPITLEDRIRITFEIANILQKQEFLRKLCKSLMLYGCPAHRLESAMQKVSRTLAVDAEYIYIPNVMLVTFIDNTTHTTETHFIRQAQSFEMHRLADIYRLEKLVSHGEVTVDEALEFIDKVSEQPAIYPLWVHPFVYAVAAFSGSILFYGARWKEAGVAAALGMVFASNEIFASFIASFQPIWEITVCILIGFVARGLQKYQFCFTPVAFPSFIIVLPGYPMAIAIIELVSRQLVSGVVRMIYALIYSFLLGYGVSMGSELYLTIDKNSDTVQSDVCKLVSNATTCIQNESPWFNFLMVPMFAFAFSVFLRARLPRFPIMVIVAACAYTINYALACWARVPSQILQVVPAFGLGMIGNLISKTTGKMSFDAVLLGVFYLVPSALGLKAAYGVFTGTNEAGDQGAGFALSMIETSIGITLGLFLATLIVYPKGTQHTPLMNL